MFDIGFSELLVIAVIATTGFILSRPGDSQSPSLAASPDARTASPAGGDATQPAAGLGTTRPVANPSATTPVPSSGPTSPKAGAGTTSLAAPSGLTAAPCYNGTRVSMKGADNPVTEQGLIEERCLGATCTDFQQIGTARADATGFVIVGLSPNSVYR
jgi:hypothetical protein